MATIMMYLLVTFYQPEVLPVMREIIEKMEGEL